jgi:D-alanyl-lipoteichoic acid acyltransferase DltB (MBOAT superfamily)
MYFVPKYILILAATIGIDYLAGICIENKQGRARKAVLAWSIVANVGVLCIFKYFNFFNENIGSLANFLGWNYSIQSLSLILPVGLSFHTFQSMSYTIEVYYGRQRAERNLGIFALYVMFYPQLVAGPIERPQNLLHQFYERHDFDYLRVTSGFKLMAWGLFKKVVIADNLALLTNAVYAHPGQFSGPLLLLATVFFAFQIFCDFSGYSDIAIGSARVMGFRLMRNFDAPYSAKSIAEFWRRWHISLSTWFKDYLYIPLGGSRGKRWLTYRNIFVVFLVSGLWHGANWTYVIWGGLHGAFMVIGAATRGFREKFVALTGLEKRPFLLDGFRIVITFSLVCGAWVFFRANSVGDAFAIYRGLARGWTDLRSSGLDGSLVEQISVRSALIGLIGIMVVEAVQMLERRGSVQALVRMQPVWVRWAIYYAGAATLFFLFADGGDQFIYFQF